MPPSAPPPASIYLTLLKVACGLTLIASLMMGMFFAVASQWLFKGHHWQIWMLGVIGVNALIAVALGVQRAREQSKAAKTPSPAPADPVRRRFAGVGRL